MESTPLYVSLGFAECSPRPHVLQYFLVLTKTVTNLSSSTLVCDKITYLTCLGLVGYSSKRLRALKNNMSRALLILLQCCSRVVFAERHVSRLGRKDVAPTFSAKGRPARVRKVVSESPTSEIDLSSTSRLSSTLPRSLRSAAWRIALSARSSYVLCDCISCALLMKTVDRRPSVWKGLRRSVCPSKRKEMNILTDCSHRYKQASASQVILPDELD